MLDSQLYCGFAPQECVWVCHMFIYEMTCCTAAELTSVARIKTSVEDAYFRCAFSCCSIGPDAEEKLS